MRRFYNFRRTIHSCPLKLTIDITSFSLASAHIFRLQIPPFSQVGILCAEQNCVLLACLKLPVENAEGAVYSNCRTWALWASPVPPKGENLMGTAQKRAQKRSPLEAEMQVCFPRWERWFCWHMHVPLVSDPGQIISCEPWFPHL